MAPQHRRLVGGPSKLFIGRAAAVVTIQRAADDMYLSKKQASAAVRLTCAKLPDKGSAWVLFPVAGTEQYYEIRHQATGMVLDVWNASTENGAPVGLWEATGGFNQQWELGQVAEDGFCIVCRWLGKALVVLNGVVDRLGQWDFWGGPNQIWDVEVIDVY